MAEHSNSSLSIKQLILTPSAITLAITLLRLVGELLHWPQMLFNRAAGGGGAIIGITWLALVFGAYFALRLTQAGDVPASTARTILYSFLGMVLVFGSMILIVPSEATHISFPGKEIVGLVVMLAGAALPFLAWPMLAKTLLAYAYAARIPVLIIMYFAIKGNWDTHYTLGPPGVAFPSFWSKFIQIAAFPQLVFWVAFTITGGALVGGVTAAVRGRKSAAAQPA